MSLYISTSAEFSTCGQYRYVLERVWGREKDRMLVIGLNPSTADENTDDPTIRRCVGFARTYGYSGLIMANLFAIRSTDPTFLKVCHDPIGPENDTWLRSLSDNAAITVAAWGNWGHLFNRGQEVMRYINRLQCFGVTGMGQPKHPLYLPASTTLITLPR